MTEAAAPSPHQALRAATAADHERIDARFGGFDLARSASYASFLAAHARALPAIEQVLSDHPELPPFASRTKALEQDLSALDERLPVSLPVHAPASAAEAWGMLYVVEGSRLGGVMLARSVPDEMPKAYLSAGHQRGGWRALLAAFDEAAGAGGASWMAEATAAARRTFDLYGQAVEAQVSEEQAHG